MDRRQQAATPAAATQVRAAGRQRLRREVRGQALELPSVPRLAVLEGTQQAVQGDLAATPPLVGLVAAAHQGQAQVRASAAARRAPLAQQPAAEEGAGALAARPAAAERVDREPRPAAAEEPRQADRASARASDRRFKTSWAARRRPAPIIQVIF